MLITLIGCAGTFPVRRSGLTLDCGAPVPLWIWYDVTNIQQMPECRSFAAEPKRRRTAALQRLFHNHKEPEIQIPVDITGVRVPALNSTECTTPRLKIKLFLKNGQRLAQEIAADG